MTRDTHNITIQYTTLTDGSPVFRVIISNGIDMYYFDCNDKESAYCFAEILRKCVTIHTNDMAAIK